MGHFQPGDDHPGALGSERLAHGLADQLAHRHDAGESGTVDVLPLIDLGAWHDQRVALCHRLNRQERDDVVVLVDEAAWQFTVDDLGEDRRHGPSICSLKCRGGRAPKGWGHASRGRYPHPLAGEYPTRSRGAAVEGDSTTVTA